MPTPPDGESGGVATTRHGDDSDAGKAVLLARDKIVLISALAGMAGTVAAMLCLALSARLESRGWLLPATVASVYFYVSFISSLKLFQSNADDEAHLQSLRNEGSDALALGAIFLIIMAIVAAFSR